MKYTPEPWKMEEGELNGVWEGVVYNDRIGTICRLDDEMSGCRANARLIAAAPELLEVVQGLLFEFEEVTDERQRDIEALLIKARAVMLQMEGRK